MSNFYSNSYIDFYQALQGVNPMRNLNEIKNTDINIDIKVIENESRNGALSEFEKEIINQKSSIFESQKELNHEVKHNNSETKTTIEKKMDIKSYYSVPKHLTKNETSLKVPSYIQVSSKKFKTGLDTENNVGDEVQVRNDIKQNDEKISIDNQQNKTEQNNNMNANTDNLNTLVDQTLKATFNKLNSKGILSRGLFYKSKNNQEFINSLNKSTLLNKNIISQDNQSLLEKVNDANLSTLPEPIITNFKALDDKNAQESFDVAVDMFLNMFYPITNFSKSEKDFLYLSTSIVSYLVKSCEGLDNYITEQKKLNFIRVISLIVHEQCLEKLKIEFNTKNVDTLVKHISTNNKSLLLYISLSAQILDIMLVSLFKKEIKPNITQTKTLSQVNNSIKINELGNDDEQITQIDTNLHNTTQHLNSFKFSSKTEAKYNSSKSSENNNQNRNQSEDMIFRPFIGSGPVEAYEIDNRSRCNRNIFKNVKSLRKNKYKLSYKKFSNTKRY